jgi:hypothetical protein
MGAPACQLMAVSPEGANYSSASGRSHVTSEPGSREAFRASITCFVSEIAGGILRWYQQVRQAVQLFRFNRGF